MRTTQGNAGGTGAPINNYTNKTNPLPIPPKSVLDYTNPAYNQLAVKNDAQIIGKLNETAAIAFSPNLPTQKVSIRLYAVCKILANTIGRDKVIKDLNIDPSVNLFTDIEIILKNT